MSIDEWFKEFGKNTRSNLELIKYCKKLKIHNVVICTRVELTNMSEHTKNIIMNLEDNNGNGFHRFVFLIVKTNIILIVMVFHHLLK